MATALAAIAAKPNPQRLGEMPLPLYGPPGFFEGVSSLTVEIIEDPIRLANAVPLEGKAPRSD